MPYKLVSDGETVGGSKTKTDIAILLQKIKAKDVLRRHHEQNK